MTWLFSLLITFMVGWFIIKLFVGVIRIFLIIVLVLVLIGMAMGTSETTVTTIKNEPPPAVPSGSGSI
jgi:hypothetical protein